MKQNINQKVESQKKIFLATILSFMFFIVYDMLVLQPQQIAKQQSQTQIKQKQIENKSINTNQTNNQAPQITSSSNKNDIKEQKQNNNNSIISTIITKNSKIEIDNIGRIYQVTLLNKVYHTKDGKQMKLFKKTDSVKPLEVRFSNNDINTLAFKTSATVDHKNIDATKAPQTLIIKQNLNNLILTKNIKFYPDGHYDVQITTSKPVDFFVSNGFRPSAKVDVYANHGVLLKLADDTLDIIKDKKLKANKDVVGVKIVSSFDRYYATMLYNLKYTFEVILMPTKEDNPQAFIHVDGKFNASGYIGPKHYKILKSINPELTSTIEYGWFTFIAKPMFLLLSYLHNLFGNWGWAIVVITILMKLLLYPLTYKGMISMQKLKDLAPKIKQIQEKYKDEPQKMSAHMMELYKKYDANPMGGCLPMLLQIPVFFALYRVLINAIELKGAPWILWIHDLSLMDPYYVLPILMGITMYFQQKITPNTMQDETQKKIFEFLPVIFTFFFAMFPAGLTLYWFMNNLLTVAQQYYINKLFQKKKALFRK